MIPGKRTVATHQQAEVLSWGEVGVADVTGGLEDSDDALHVAGEAEAVVGNDQQLHDYGKETEDRTKLKKKSVFLITLGSVLQFSKAR